jgi:hypothetical protein
MIDIFTEKFVTWNWKTEEGVMKKM